MITGAWPWQRGVLGWPVSSWHHATVSWSLHCMSQLHYCQWDAATDLVWMCHWCLWSRCSWSLAHSAPRTCSIPLCWGWLDCPHCPVCCHTCPPPPPSQTPRPPWSWWGRMWWGGVLSLWCVGSQHCNGERRAEVIHWPQYSTVWSRAHHHWDTIQHSIQGREDATAGSSLLPTHTHHYSTLKARA